MPLKETFSAGPQQEHSLVQVVEASARLATFPTEILEHIFSNFCLHCRYTSKPDADATFTDTSSPLDTYWHGQQHPQIPDEPSWYSLDRHVLFSLSLVSRRFRDIAQPILYHEFALGAGDSWRSTRYTWDGRLSSFLRTVAERRDLAVLVRSLWVHPFLRDKMCLTADGEVDQASAAAVNSTLHHSACLLGIRPEHYLAQFRRPRPGATGGIDHHVLRVMFSQLLGLVIAALPNMEHLSLQSSSCPARISAAALEAAGFTGLRLTSLEVSSRPIAGLPTRRRLFNLNDEAIGVLEMAPNLSVLKLHRGCCTGWTPPLENLRVLTITNSALERDDLAASLSRSTQLEAFFYEQAPEIFWGSHARRPGPDYHMGEPGHVRPSDPINLLGLPKNKYKSLHLENETLKSLHLDFRNRPGLAYQQPIPSLEGFTALQNLFLNPDMICPGVILPPTTHIADAERLAADQLTQRLPATIVTLKLAGRLTWPRDRPCLTRALLGLAQAVSQGAFVHLREVSCDAAEEQLTGDEEQEAARLLENAGVRFGYRDWPLSRAPLEMAQVSHSLEVD